LRRAQRFKAHRRFDAGRLCTTRKFIKYFNRKGLAYILSGVPLDPYPEPSFDPAPVIHIIEKLRPWRQARKTDRYGKPQIPHAYIVRGRPPENEALYVALFWAIQSLGREERCGRKRRRYLYLGEFKYWAMTTDVDQSTVLNRMLIEDDLERLRRTGQV
jgi:hypothetical protein